MNQQITLSGWLFILGLIAWLTAGSFGLYATVEATAPRVPETNDRDAIDTVSVRQPNVAAAGTACGFAIGGGLCFLGAALAGGRPHGATPSDLALQPAPATHDRSEDFRDVGSGPGN